MSRLKTHRMTIRFSDTEAAQVRAQARAVGVTVSEWIRAAALNKPAKTAADLEVLNELRRQGGLLKHLYNEGTLDPAKSYEALCTLQNVAAQLLRE